MVRYALAVMALGLAGPALAHPATPARAAPDAAQVSVLLSTPLVQDAVTARLDDMADAVLQTRIGPLARFVDPRDQVRPDDTLADLAARRNPAYRRDLQAGARRAVAATGQALHDYVLLSAELRRTGDRLRRVLDKTRAEIDALR